MTLEAGIDFVHRLPTAELDNIVDSLGSGAAFADLDEDGWLDLIVLGGPRSPRDDDRPEDHAGIRLYRNLENGSFLDVTADSGIPSGTTAVAVAIADIDGDGKRDIYLLDRGPNRLFQNRGDWRFEDVTRKTGVGDDRFGVGAAFFDMEQDGDLDLYVVNYLDFDSRDQSFFAPEGFPGPLTHDAQPDVIYENKGDGTFVDVTSSSGIDRSIGRGMSVSASDFDDDGDLDLFVANDATANFLLLNDGTGHFSDAALEAGVAMGENGEQTGAMAAAIGDVDGDGQADLLVSDTAFGAFYRRVAPGLFTDEVMSAGLGVLCGQYVSWGQNLLDYDNDGDLDLFVVNGDLHHLVGWEDLLLRNSGIGSYEDASFESGPYFADQRVSRSSITGDYDNDGDVDLFVTTLKGRPFLLRNDHSSAPSWITVDLTSRSMRDPFGARVEVLADGKRWTAEHRFRTSYLGQSDHRLHFGLGQATDRLESVRIVWPNGESQTLTDVTARQHLRIEEGTS